MLQREQVPDTPEAGQHLVENEQSTSLVAALAKRGHEPLRRYAHPPCSLYRFDHYRSCIRLDPAERRLVIVRQAPYRSRQRLERRTKGVVAHQRQRSYGVAVISTIKCDE